MKLEIDIYAESKRLRLEEINDRIRHLESDYNYWQKQYFDHGDKFSMGMTNVSLYLWSSHKSLRDFISRFDVICLPKMTYNFPEVDETGS